MGGAQPLAVTMCGGVALCVEVDAERIRRRIESGYLDAETTSLDEALRWADGAVAGAAAAEHRPAAATPPTSIPSW